MKLTLSKVAVPRADALCEHSKSPAVALVLMVRVFDTTFVQVTPSADTEAVNVFPTLVNFIQALGNVYVPPPTDPLKF